VIRAARRTAAIAALAALAAFGLLALSGPAAAQTLGPNAEAEKCLSCHGDQSLGTIDVSGVQKTLFVDATVYGTSLHGLLDCTSCHLGFKPRRHVAAESANWLETAKLTACGNCHADQFAMYSGSFHGHLALGQAGSNAPLCADCHVAHNALIGNHVIMSNVATLAGHVKVEDYAVIGGLAAVHQFCRIGTMSIIGGCSKVVQDVPPFMLVDGNPGQTRTVNKVWMKRNGVSE